jgi:hypothetical protein
MKNISLTKKIMILCFLVLLIASMISFVHFKWANDGLVEKVRDKFQTDALMLGQNVTSILYERYYDVQAFATNKSITKLDSKEEITKTLNALVTLYGVYDLIMVVDAKGDYIASSSVDSFGIDLDTKKIESNYANETWFKKVMNGEFTKGKIFHGTFVEQPHFDPLTSRAADRPLYGTSFSTSIKGENGEVLGVITARANFKWIANLFASFYRSIKEQNYLVKLSLVDGAGKLIFDYDPEGAKSEKFIYDETFLGKVILHSENPAVEELLKGKKGSDFIFDKKISEEVLVGYSPLDSSHFFDEIKWGVMVQIPKVKAFGTILANEKNFLYGICFAFGLSLLIAFGIAKLIGKAFITQSRKLSESSEASHSLSSVLFETSDSVASAAVEQSTGIQESVSALAEMGSMISQTVNSAKTSMDAVQKVNNKAKEGENIMEEMMYSFRSIQEASQQLERISEIIMEISKKTTIINDIVFKTQLLSFNASIEAARAGQHGKGFAVVAEEVGNLAKVSGNAAKDIEQMLHDSQKQVQEILHGLHDKIDKSSSVSNQAVSNFKDISNEIDVIVTQIRGITDACSQQELGVQQTSTAMNQIDVATQKNSTTAQESLSAAKKLSDENKKLKDISENLFRLINGKRTKIRELSVDETAGHSNRGESELSLEESIKVFINKRGGHKDNKDKAA